MWAVRGIVYPRNMLSTPPTGVGWEGEGGSHVGGKIPSIFFEKQSFENPSGDSKLTCDLT